jgi:muconate cycloisomerase
MHLFEFQLFDLKLPFCREVSHSLFTRNHTEAIIAVVYEKNGCCGFGEGTPRSFVTCEDFQESLSAAEKLAKMLCGHSIDSFNELLILLKDTGNNIIAKQNPAAWCALELSCLDLFAKKENIPFWQLFTQKLPEKVFEYSAVLPLISEKQTLNNILQLVKSMRISNVKIKVSDSKKGIDLFRHVRRALGPYASLRADANAAFTPDQAVAFLEGTVTDGIEALEQPVAKQDLEGLAKVANISPVPIIADESLYVEGGPEHFIDLCLCQGINLRISSCGGFLKSLKLIERVKQNGMIWQLGAHVGETAILSLAGRHFAAVSSGFMHMEGSFSKLVLKEDLCDTDICFGVEGKASLTNEPGLGVKINIEKLKKWSKLVTVVK